jgi:uncharacterized membrane protein YvbJ
MTWVDVVYCRNCGANHGEDSIQECEHCEKDACPSCASPTNERYHEVCRILVDGE